MSDKKFYIVSFGDSDKYGMEYPGTKEEFEASPEFRHVCDTVYSRMKEKFPNVKYAAVIAPLIQESEGRENVYDVLDKGNLERLVKDVERQIEVKMEAKRMNSNAANV